jgi:hypothetical protein
VEKQVVMARVQQVEAQPKGLPDGPAAPPAVVAVALRALPAVKPQPGGRAPAARPAIAAAMVAGRRTVVERPAVGPVAAESAWPPAAAPQVGVDAPREFASEPAAAGGRTRVAAVAKPQRPAGLVAPAPGWMASTAA